MLEKIRRIDAGWARFEGWLTVLVLILMVVVAGFAAGVRNLTRFDVSWANALLNDMDWADSLLRKGTMWLAFLGASLASYHGKHINIDMLLRIAPPRLRFSMMAFSNIVAGILTMGLVICFSAAVYLNLTERPVEYEILGANGQSEHVCDATAAELKAVVDVERPTIFCAARKVLSVVSIPAETPGAAFQLIVPLMLVVVGLRLFGAGIHFFGIATGSNEVVARADEEEREQMLAQQAAGGGKI
jgi:TRAP-type C4-dicarboxylate transport system permease small subunit